MIQKEAPDRAEKRPSLNPAPPAIATMTKKRFDELAEIQSDLLEEIREAGQNWLDRMQSEATIAPFRPFLAGRGCVPNGVRSG